MLLSVDIGNSNIVFALSDKDNSLFEDARIETFQINSEKSINDFLAPIFKENNISLDNIDDVIICSVVPNLDDLFANWSESINSRTTFVGAKNANLIIKIDEPESLGADRIAACVGAKHKYGNNLIVIDFGTATTFEVINEKGEYVGGVIAPGVKTSMNALSSSAVKIDQYDFAAPKTHLPKNLEDALSAGIYYGYIGLVKEIIIYLKKSIIEDSEIKVIATGGLGKEISQNLDMINLHDNNLVTFGLREIYRNLDQ